METDLLNKVLYELIYIKTLHRKSERCYSHYIDGKTEAYKDKVICQKLPKNPPGNIRPELPLPES